MQPSQPVILIVTTQTWLQLTRLALRFARYGCKVSVLCTAQSELRYYEGLHTRHVFHPRNPLHSLEAAITASGADYVVPGDDPGVWLLHELSERSPGFRDLIERSIGPAHSFATVRSRFALLTLAARLGIAAPETAIARTAQAAKQWSNGRGVPFLVKKDGTFGGGGVEVVSEASALEGHYARLNARPHLRERAGRMLVPNDKELVMPFSWISDAEISVQTYIEGVAANAMFACDQGRILGSVQARVHAAKGRTGAAVMIELIRDERIERAGELLARSLELSGFFGLDFILERGTGVPYLLEMNPRCTQMGHIAVAGQADLAGILWSQWSGHPAPAMADRKLSNAIAFYPQALQWPTARSFLKRARFDVCPEDRPLVDRLALGNPALLARSYQALRARLKRLKYRFVPQRRAPIYYFAPTLSPDRQEAGVQAATLEPFPPGYQQVTVG